MDGARLLRQSETSVLPFEAREFIQSSTSTPLTSQDAAMFDVFKSLIKTNKS